MAGPTPFPDLNGVLAELVEGVQTILGGNFCGAYLQGSFAVGDADVYSDVDFIVVTHDDLTDDQQAALQGMHARTYKLDIPWAKHLEGSYVPKDRLRRVDPFRAPYFYLDNGATELIWDNHCNTAVVRSSLREHGVILAGPDPKALLERVSKEQLADEVRAAMDEWATWARESRNRYEAGDALSFSCWKQPYLVLSLCRMLHTLNSGTVTSKREAGEWALGVLDPCWASLIERALDDRPDPWARVHQPAEAEPVASTLEFLDYALDQTGRYADSS